MFGFWSRQGFRCVRLPPDDAPLRRRIPGLVVILGLDLCGRKKGEGKEGRRTDVTWARKGKVDEGMRGRDCSPAARGHLRACGVPSFFTQERLVHELLFYLFG